MKNSMRNTIRQNYDSNSNETMANLLDQANRFWDMVKLIMKVMIKMKALKYTYNSNPIASPKKNKK